MKQLLIVFFVFGIYTSTFAQIEEKGEVDNELWVGYSAKIKLSEKWKLGLKTQQRYNDNFTGLKLNFMAVNLGYKVNKHIGLRTDYRHTWRPEKRNLKRYTFDFLAKKKIKKYKLRLEYRSRFLLNIAHYTGETTSDFRNKLSLSSKLNKKIVPFVGYELFYELYEFERIDAHRFTAGVNWRLKKNLDLKTYLRFDREVNRDTPNRQRIIGIILSQSF